MTNSFGSPYTTRDEHECLEFKRPRKETKRTIPQKTAKQLLSHSGGYVRVLEANFQRNSGVVPLGSATATN